MSTLSKAGLASTLAFMASVTAANAQDVDVIVNDDMNADLYQIAEDINIPGTSTITRGRHDRAAGVYCEWEEAPVSTRNTTLPFCKRATRFVKPQNRPIRTNGQSARSKTWIIS